MPAHVEAMRKVHSTSERTQRPSILRGCTGMAELPAPIETMEMYITTDQEAAPSMLTSRLHFCPGRYGCIQRLPNQRRMLSMLASRRKGKKCLHKSRPGGGGIALPSGRNGIQG